MVSILAMSDLHTEFAPFEIALPADPDLVLLAGDIGRGAAGITFARNYFRSDTPVVVICGNHEFFGGNTQDVLQLCRMEAEKTPNVHFIENGEVVLSFNGVSVRIVGCVLWSDFELFGTQESSFEAAQSRLADFQMIKEDFGGTLRPETTALLHRASRNWLRARLSLPFTGHTVVMTHHAPSPKSQHPRFISDALTPAFVSDLEDVIRQFQPSLWVHGHTHWSVDYRVGRTRIYSN